MLNKEGQIPLWAFPPLLLSPSNGSVMTAMDDVPSFPRVDVLHAISGEPISRSCKNCAAVTEVDASPWFIRTSCSFNSSGERREHTQEIMSKGTIAPKKLKQGRKLTQRR
jgi:hypothetical protein